MDRELVAELFCAAVDGLSARHVTPALSKARQAWLLLDPNERQIFKGEILKDLADVG
jgi:hypothetical protein